MHAQSSIDSLLKVIATAKPDSSKVFSLSRLAAALMFSSPDSSLQYANEALTLAQKISFELGEAQALSIIANNYSIKGNHNDCFKFHIQALRIYEKIDYLSGVGNTYNNIALIYDDQGDYTKALANYLKAKEVYERLEKKDKAFYEKKKLNNNLVIIFNNIGNDYEKLNKLDTALQFQRRAYNLAMRINDLSMVGTILTNQGNIHYKLANHAEALSLYQSSLSFSADAGDKQSLAEAKLGIATILKEKDKRDSAFIFANESFVLANECSYLKGQERAAMLLSTLYENRNKMDSALKYYKFSAVLKDSISNTEIVRQLHLMSFNEQLFQQERKAAEEQYQSNLKIYALIGGIGILLLIAGFLYRNNKQKHRANMLLHQQKEETEKQRKKAEKALEVLKATQAQLIQQEKMASLGELTAGIAHEIQNPLNFVNNFSEVSIEMLEEASEEIQAGNKKEALNALEDAKANLHKVVHHGSRADSIVKSMLEHSRSAKGEKMPTDLNALVDEYLKLAYNGYRAKDKTFNTILESHFDPLIGKVNISPQEIGRVLLNLFNNAFYSVQQKKKLLNGNYEPLIQVSTVIQNGSIKLAVKDNGLGIPEKSLHKIFQPFFTTKPTGEGTGLGLSLSYDIITKGHNGELKVESTNAEGTTFLINLPINTT